MKRFLCIALTAFSSSSIYAYELKEVVTGLVQPVGAVPGKSDPHVLYITEHAGRVVTFDTATQKKGVFLDIRDRVTQSGEAGLQSLAFHPRFLETGAVYVAYNAKTPRLAITLSEFRGTAERKLLSIAKRFSNHNGGQVVFGPDGLLYLSTGDGGGAGDPDNNSQNKSSLLGKMLRLNVDAGNPKPEIFALGLRNVWRFSFDRETGKLFGADVGQDKLEEINVIEKGGNYGWNIMEASQCFRPASGCQQKGLTKPIFEYGREEGVSITGGYVYRGTKIPALKGAYVYGDYGSGKIWALRYDQSTGTVSGNVLLLESGLSISAFAEEADGEILVIDHTGTILRLAP